MKNCIFSSRAMHKLNLCFLAFICVFLRSFLSAPNWIFEGRKCLSLSLICFRANPQNYSMFVTFLWLLCDRNRSSEDMKLSFLRHILNVASYWGCCWCFKTLLEMRFCFVQNATGAHSLLLLDTFAESYFDQNLILSAWKNKRFLR